MNLNQLTRLREVCVSAQKHARDSALFLALRDAASHLAQHEQATAAIADIDAEIAKLKGIL